MIFLSYSRQDATAADAVQRALQAWGFEVFRDTDPDSGTEPGKLWMQELYREVRRAECVVVLDSAHSARSRWCIAEVTLAHVLNKKILPVFLEGAPVDRVLSDIQGVTLAELDRLGTELRRAAPRVDRSRSPYPGLAPYEAEDAPVFCGRRADIERGLLKIRELPLSTERFLVVYGPSGSGKSSLLRAGWLPALAQEPARWLPTKAFRPEGAPFHWLTAALPDGVAREGVECRTAEAMRDASRRWRALQGAQDAEVVLAVDQLEELLNPAARPIAGEFLAAVHEATREPSSRMLVVATLRSDHLGAFQELAGDLGIRYESLAVGGPTREHLREIVVKPASLVGLEVEEELVEEVTRVIESADVLPLLAKALQGVYALDREKGRLTVASLRSLGGVLGSIEDDALRAVGNLDEERLAPLKSAFLVLAERGPDRTWVRRSARWSELPPEAQPFLKKLEDRRLVVTDGDGVRVAHEAVFRNWKQLAAWLEDRSADVELQGRLLQDAREWDGAGRPPDHPLLSLWCGGRLQAARSRLDGATPELQGAFLQRAQDAELDRLQADQVEALSRYKGLEAQLAETLEEEERVEFDDTLDSWGRASRYDGISYRARELRERLLELRRRLYPSR